jgi:pimeloyl-ACP methyl ester carboxylesterase
MSRRTLTLMLATPLLTAALASAPVPVADATLVFAPCVSNAGFSCATAAVPLDRTGAVPGTISLSVEQKPAGVIPSQSAVLALAGGPGQAALPYASQLAKAIAPALTSRDLLVVDQRGTGTSDPLSCPIFNNFRALEQATEGTFGALIELCALQIGPARGAFTTKESVEDLEAIRHAAGYKKLVLYGTSYGTKVALEYAERYPQHVEALVLDSVVLSSGPEPFDIAKFQAMAPALEELCSNRACAGITSNPLADLARLTAQLRRHELRGSAYDGGGHRHAVSLGEFNLLLILDAGDLNPALRALLPAAVRSALRHDPSPLLRLSLLAEGLIPSVPKTVPNPEAERTAREEENNALFFATTCEETPFPWRRTAPAATRNEEALGALSIVPSSDFYPFDATSALHSGTIPSCENWPDASAPPSPPSPLPNVPTLLLSGAQDLRTPTSNARSVAAQIPDAQLLVVPYTGHSVLGADFSDCAANAVGTFFAGGAIQPCSGSADAFAPTPIAPTALAYVHSPPGLGGRPGRTLTAVLDAIVDLDRQVIAATLQAQQELPSGSSFGGLRGGYARLTGSTATLKRFSFVAGVQLSGTFPVKNGELQPATIRISGAGAAPGAVRFAADKRVTGTLGGRHFNVSLASVRLSRAGATGQWPSHAVSFPLPGLIDARPVGRR